MSDTVAAQGKPAKKKIVVISMITLAIMNITTIMSLRGMPSLAEYGLASISYYVLGAIFLLVPTALVAAELASSYPGEGGIFRWVSEAFGPDWGFASIFYEWAAIVVFFPTVLIFASVAIAYIAAPQSFDAALASNKFYVIAVVLAVYWAVTLFTFRGIGSSAKLSKFGGLFGTIIPGAILIIMGIIYVVMGHPIHMPMHTGIIPTFSGIGSFVLAASIFLFFAGMEMQAVHIGQLKNPSRDFPLSVLIATIVILSFFILGTLAIGVVIPQKDINLTQSLMVAYRDLFSTFHVPWMGNVLAGMLAIGVLGQVSVIVAGPSTGLLAVGKAGYLPKFFQRTNKNGIQVPILILQGVIVSLLALAIVLLPSVQSAYQILGQMATIIILAMYVIMYLAGIRLRYTQPNKQRPFKIPGGNFGMWCVGGIGLVGALAAGFLSFVPPQQIKTGSPAIYIGVLLIGSVVALAIPFIIYKFHKPGWKEANNKFAPFDWQIEGRKPSQISTSSAAAGPGAETAATPPTKAAA